MDKMDVIETAKRLFEDREEYFKELEALKEDISFFDMYMKRNKKSKPHVTKQHCHLLNLLLEYLRILYDNQ